MKKKLALLAVLALGLTSCAAAEAEPVPAVTVTAEPVQVEVAPYVCLEALQGMADMLIIASEMQEKVGPLARSMYTRDFASAEALQSGYTAKDEEMQAMWPDLQPKLEDCKAAYPTE